MPNSNQLKNNEAISVETEIQEPEKKLELVSAEIVVTNQQKMEKLLDKMSVVAEKIKHRNKKKSK